MGDGTIATTALICGYVEAARSASSPPFEPPRIPTREASTSSRFTSAATAAPTVSTGTSTSVFGNPGNPKYATDAVT